MHFTSEFELVVLTNPLIFNSVGGLLGVIAISFCSRVQSGSTYVQ